MTKCDVALASDAEAMVSGNALSGCPAIDCIIHAGGVLKVLLILLLQNADFRFEGFYATQLIKILAEVK